MKKSLLLSLAACGLLALAASPADAHGYGRGGFGGGNFRGNFGYGGFNSFGYGYGFAPQFVTPFYYQQAVVVAPQVVYAQPQAVAAPQVIAAPLVEAYVVPPVGFYATPLYGAGYTTAVFQGRTFYGYGNRGGHGGHGGGHGRR